MKHFVFTYISIPPRCTDRAVESLHQSFSQLLLLLNSKDGLLMLKAHVAHVLTYLLLLDSTEHIPLITSSTFSESDHCTGVV